MLGWLRKIFGTAQDRRVKRYRSVVAQVNQWNEQYKSLSNDQLKEKTVEFKERLAKGETVDQLLPEAYAVVKEACRRMAGTEIHVSGYNQQWDMVPYDVQIIGAIAMHHGCIVEMQTGEGKTLTAVMPLYLNALTGKPVHLVTVNDYLAQRDEQWVGSVLRWLGLTTASLTNATPMEERPQVYKADVVYGTASEFGFDYLRDNSMALSKEQQVQRGYYFSIIDEVDSILIDEARTPLIISGPVPESRQMYDQLKEGVFDLVKRQRDLCNRLATEARKTLDLPDAPPQAREEALRKLWLVSKGTPNNKILKRTKEDPDLRAELDQWDLYYYGDTNKEERHKALSELFIIIDEKANEHELTDKGIQSWVDHSSGIGKIDDFIMLDISHEYLLIDQDNSLSDEEKIQRRTAVQEEDARRKERAHNLRQLLRAHLLMEKDVDYIVQDGKIVIIDEHTGRPQPGRRFSDGLHQAIEAKEGVAIQRETQTYATITLQNYFRMYEKLTGMSGTVTTEANEFKQIYNLEALEIPTHRPCIRQDFNDEIYMSEREKYNAIVKEVAQEHAKGRPILIGTESVEVSEKLSRILRQNQLEHTVLNAKHHEKEAEIVATAGKRGAITIATNMAGRGTDIKLEKGVADIGGLYVVGTTRHQSRRIDRQLRGRSARLGDPGSSKFFVSFEDSLMRLFASPRLTSVLQRFRPPEGEPISAGILNKSIETAQKRVEQRNSAIRKHTLEYDDVMNKQRQAIYSFRNEILQTADIVPVAQELLEEVCLYGADQHLVSRGDSTTWNLEGYRQWLMHIFPIHFPDSTFDDERLEGEELAMLAYERVSEAFTQKVRQENEKASQAAGRPIEPASQAIRNLMIRINDNLWIEHLLKMDHLRSDVNLRSVGQRDPLMEFKHEAFRLFEQYTHTMREQIAQALFRFEVIVQPVFNPMMNLGSFMRLETGRSFLPEESLPETEEAPPEPPKSVPFIAESRAGRNEDCPCGSGKKYKKCCGVLKEEEKAFS